MEIIKGLDFKILNSAVSLGKFDGIHKGHRLLLNEVLKHKENIPTVFTFDVNRNDRQPDSGMPVTRKVIYSQQEKELILNEIGIQREVLFPFNKITRDMEPEEFIEDFLVGKMDVRFICVGEDFRFGKGRRGNVGMLKKYASKYGYDIKIFHKLTSEDEIISSTLIREKIENGDVKRANELLGEPYFIMGEVIHGNAIGRTLDMPTANIVPEDEKVLMPSGVYASTVELDGEVYKSVTNVGKKPTVGSDVIGVETYIFGFDRDIYGKNIKVNFYEYLRPEKKFPDLNELKNQMEMDKQKAAGVLKKRYI